MSANLLTGGSFDVDVYVSCLLDSELEIADAIDSLEIVTTSPLALTNWKIRLKVVDIL
jgi:hypothetical protein